MGPDGPREELQRIVRSLGCEVRERAKGGVCIDCPSHEVKLQLLDALAWWDCRYQPLVRRAAVYVATHAATDERHRVDSLDLAKKLHSYVCNKVRFLGEGPEVFQSTTETLTTGVGDCDDSARALLALARAVAIPARLVALDKGKTAELEPTHASVQLSPNGKDWYWAETSLGPRAFFGEHPIAAVRRLKAARSDITGGAPTLGDLDGLSDQTARPLIVEGWKQVLGREPSTFEAQLTAAIALAETGYGIWPAGHGEGSHNQGAIMCSSGSVEGPACFPHADSFQDGQPFPALFKVYPDDQAGMTDLVRELTTRRPLTRAALARGSSVYDVSQAMYREHYYGSTCPEAIRTFGPAAAHESYVGSGSKLSTGPGQACDREAVAIHAKRVHSLASKVASSLGETAPTLGGPPTSTATWLVLAAAGLAAAVGVAHHEGWLP